MSAFCNKYPSCGCVGFGTKCYDDGLVIENEDLPKIKGGCNLSAAADVPCNQNHVNEVKSVEIPKEKQVDMIAYAKELRRKFPHMAQNRIMKKTAQYFKVKLT